MIDAAAPPQRACVRRRLALAGRRLRRWLAAGLLGLLGGGALLVQVETVKDGHAGVFRPGGLAPRQTEHALGHDAQGVLGCLKAGEQDRRSPERAELSRLFAILATSETGAAILRQARLRRVHACIDDATDLFAYYFAGMGVLGVNAELSEGGKLAFLAHELAHVPQHPSHSDNRYYGPHDLVLLRRVREAAAEAIATRIAWELREAGYGAAWDEKLATVYGDVARAFEGAAAADPSEDGLLRATRAAFDRWFEAPWRRNVYDRMTLRHLARISRDAMGLVPPRYVLRHAFVTDIAWLNGRNFLSETGARPLTDRAYAGRISARNAGPLERFLDRAMLTVTPFGVSPLGGLVS